MEKTKYRCPYISDATKLCSMSVPCCNCVQFSPDYLEKIFTSSQQLQAKIRAIADGLEIAYRGADPMAVDNTVNELRELSAVK